MLGLGASNVILHPVDSTSPGQIPTACSVGPQEPASLPLSALALHSWKETERDLEEGRGKIYVPHTMF